MSELSAENLADLEKKYQTTAIIIIAQIFTLLVLIVSVWFLAPDSQNPISQQTLILLWAAIIFVALGTFILRRLLFRWDRLKDITLLKGVSGLLKTLQVNAIILVALAETIAIFGLVIAVLSGETFEIFRAGLVSLILFWLNFPRKSVWQKIVANLQEV